MSLGFYYHSEGFCDLLAEWKGKLGKQDGDVQHRPKNNEPGFTS